MNELVGIVVTSTKLSYVEPG